MLFNIYGRSVSILQQLEIKLLRLVCIHAIFFRTEDFVWQAAFFALLKKKKKDSGEGMTVYL